MVPQIKKISIENLKSQRFLKILPFVKNTSSITNLKNTKGKYQDFLGTLEKYLSLKKFNLNFNTDLNENHYGLKKKKKERFLNLIKPKNLKSQVGFIYFK